MLLGFLVEGLRPPFSPIPQREYKVFSLGGNGWERGGGGGAHAGRRGDIGHRKKGERGEKGHGWPAMLGGQKAM